MINKHTSPTSTEIEGLTDSYGQLHEDDCELATLEDGSYDGCTCDMKHLTQAIQRLIQEAKIAQVQKDYEQSFKSSCRSCQSWPSPIAKYFNDELKGLQAQLQQLQKEANEQHT